MMDDSKREGLKIKRSKIEIKSVVNTYLQKRNYYLLQPFEVTKNQQLTYSQIEHEVSRGNSILFNSPNCDPQVVDQNFAKFLTWWKIQKKKSSCNDLDQLIGPLFCHLCIEIYNDEHKERPNGFFRNYLSSFDRNKCEPIVRDLINLIGKDAEITEAKELFRSKKTVVDSCQQCLDLLKLFVEQQCHVVFLQVSTNLIYNCLF